MTPEGLIVTIGEIKLLVSIYTIFVQQNLISNIKTFLVGKYLVVNLLISLNLT